MSKETIQINDFGLFVDAVKSLAKFAESSKFIVNLQGLFIYSKNNCARCEIHTNAIESAKDIVLNIADLLLLLKILLTVKEVHDKDFSNLAFTFDGAAIHVSSNKMKTKLQLLRDDELILKWVSQKLVTPLMPVFEFNTTSDIIKQINSHSFIISDSSALRIYLSMDKTLEKNVLYATLGNETNSLNNSLTLKFGLVTFGALNDRKLILDQERLNVFNILPSNDIKIQLMDKNVLVSSVKTLGKNDTFLNLTIYNSLRKS